MTREEMLAKLHSLPFNVLWPAFPCDDLDSTESPIWVDDEGYGYYYCDQPNTYYKVKRIPDEKWREIRKRLANDTLSPKDLEKTSLRRILEFLRCDEDDYICGWLSSLLDLPEKLGDYFYCGFDEDQVRFYKGKEELVDVISRIHDDHDTLWEDLSDLQLQCWIEGLHNGPYDQGFDFFETLE